MTLCTVSIQERFQIKSGGEKTTSKQMEYLEAAPPVLSQPKKTLKEIMLLYEARLLEFTDLEYLIYLKICLLGHQDYIKRYSKIFH